MIDATSFKTEEILPLKLDVDEYGGYIALGVLFFDPSGETLYAELAGVEERMFKQGTRIWSST